MVDVTTEAVEVHIEGFIYVLGMSREVKVIINSTHFYFHIEGDMFSVFHASLTVEASYGGALEDMSYAVSIAQ